MCISTIFMHLTIHFHLFPIILHIEKKSFIHFISFILICNASEKYYFSFLQGNNYALNNIIIIAYMWNNYITSHNVFSSLCFSCLPFFPFFIMITIPHESIIYMHLFHKLKKRFISNVPINHAPFRTCLMSYKCLKLFHVPL